MMRKTTRYILRQLIGPLLFISFGITGVVWLTQSLRFIDLIVNKGLSILTFLHFTMLLLPSILTLILPIGLFCAVIYTYDRLTMESELVVLRAAGFSGFQLAGPALVLAGIMTLVCYTFSLYLMPLGFRAFKDQQFTLRSDYSRLLLQEGAFNSIGDDVTVYVRAREPNGKVLGILVHDHRTSGRPLTVMAERGALVRTSDGAKLVLFKGNRQEIDRDTRQLGLLYFDEYTFDLTSYFDRPEDRWREPREQFLHELFGTPDDDADRYFAKEMRAEGHNRLVSPLYCVAFTLVALAGLIGGEFNRRRTWRRIVITGICGVALQGIGLTLVNSVVNTPVLVPLIYASVFLAGGGALYMLVDHRRWRAGEAAAADPRGA